MVKYNYDNKFDILYIAIADKSNSYSDDMDDVVISRDVDTDKITGAMVYDFMGRMIKGDYPESLPSCFSKSVVENIVSLINQNCFKSTLVE